MAFTKTLLYGFVVLTTSYLVTAQEESNQKSGPQFPSFGSLSSGGFGGFQLPNFQGFGFGSDAGSFGFLAFPLNFFSGLSGGSSTAAPQSDSSTSAITAAARKRRQANENEEPQEHQNRLFFSAVPTITSCNFTTQGGSSCLSCTQALRCRPNNIGILTRCRGLFRHCNNGRCSLTQSAACASGTTAATTAASTAATTASGAAGTAATTAATTAAAAATTTAATTAAATAAPTTAAPAG